MEKHATFYHKRLISGAFFLLYAAIANAQNIDTDSVPTKEKDLNQAQVVAKRKPVSKLTGPENGFVLSRTELFTLEAKISPITSKKRLYSMRKILGAKSLMPHKYGAPCMEPWLMPE